MKYRKNGILHDFDVIQGMSAYQSAVIGGYDKSEEEFYKELSDLATNTKVEEVKEEIEGEVGQLAEEIADQTNSFITNKMPVKLEWEEGNISSTSGNNQSSTAWHRTVGFLHYDNEVTVTVDRLNGHNRQDLYCYSYSNVTGDFLERQKVFSSYSVDTVDIILEKDKKYRFTNANYQNHEVSWFWDFNINSDIVKVLKQKSNTVSRVEALTTSEFNSRPINEDVFTNDVQYMIYGDNFTAFHNGKTSGKHEKDYLCKFAIISDTHIGNTSYNDEVKAKYINMCNHINEKDIDFVIELGDCIDNGYANTSSDIIDFQTSEHGEIFSNLNYPLYSFGGNHDTGIESYSKYGTIDFNGVRIIKFDADYVGLPIPSGRAETVWSSGIVTEQTLEYIDKQLSESKAKVNIVCCHYALAEDLTYRSFIWWIQDTVTKLDGTTVDCHRDDLIAILKKYNVKLYINGHEHHWNKTTNALTLGKVEDGAWSISDLNQPSTQDHYTIATVYADSIKYEAYETATNSLVDTQTVSI